MSFDPIQAQAALTLFGRRRPTKVERAIPTGPNTNDRRATKSNPGLEPPPGIPAGWEALAAFSEDGPEPIPLIEDQGFKAVLVGLRAGQWIPKHTEATAVYIFLKGSGSMGVGDDISTFQAGAIVVAPEGAQRGIEAQTDVVFLAALGEYPAGDAA